MLPETLSLLVSLGNLIVIANLPVEQYITSDWHRAFGLLIWFLLYLFVCKFVMFA